MVYKVVRKSIRPIYEDIKSSKLQRLIKISQKLIDSDIILRDSYKQLSKMLYDQRVSFVWLQLSAYIFCKIQGLPQRIHKKF